MVKVSVVIPVYNVEDFLEECLNSIVNQSLKDIEIICVNDGSKDKSLEILNSFAENDDRFTVIDQENQGHAVATNRGMELAKGEFLYLMDSDDILGLTALEETYEYAKLKNADFVIFQSLNYANDTDMTYESEIYSMDKVADFIGDGVVTSDDLKNLIFSITVTPWSKIYNNEFVKRINAKFPEGLIFDDNIFFWEVLFNAERIAFLKKFFFTRRWYSFSSTKAGDLRFLDSIKINNLMIEVFKKYGKFEEYKEILYNRKVNLGFMRFDQIKDEFKEQYFKELKADFIEYKNNTDIYDYLNERNQLIFDSCINSDNARIFWLSVRKFDIVLRQINARIDIVNTGEGNECIDIMEISDENSLIDYPDWFDKDNGKGAVINSQKAYLDIKVSCVQDGNLKITLRSRNIHDEDGNRIPVLIDYYNLKINDEVILNEITTVWHDKPYRYSKDVVKSEVVNIHIEWLPLDVSINNIFGTLMSENKKLKSENKKIRKDYNKLLKSKSWSLTKPLRQLKNIR